LVRVSRVHPGSVGEQIGILPGTELLSVNGRELDDFLDWEFLTAEEDLLIAARRPDGEILEIEFERDLGEPLGVELEPPRVRRCANKCEFCFIEGLPQGLRRNLYVRDDDYRLSFAYGNFATLSNLKERDFERILEYRLSPLYVSVHATPWEVRKVLLNNPRVPNVVEQLQRLAAGGIEFHAQMVIVPDMNDGEVLQQSLADLWALGDSVLSVAVVPVGLTQFSHLYSGRSMDAPSTGALLEQVERWEKRALEERGTRWVFGSDELYLLAGQPLPDAAHYEDFAQIENGVGAIASLRRRIATQLDELPRLDGRRIGVVTGQAMAPLMPELLESITTRTGARFELLVAENSLFGPTITTAGLLVGKDVVRMLEARADLDLALIPAESINEDGIFLDDVRFIDVRENLPMPVYPSYDFIDVLSLEGEGVSDAEARLAITR
jgi:putative radical SAM enzyme (TIGR03279 family)